MKSIQTKFASLALASILICTVLVGSFGIWFTIRAQEQSSDEILALTCLNNADTIDQALSDIMASVDSCADVIEGYVGSPSELSDATKLETKLSSAEKLVSSIASNAKGVYAYYVRFDPDLSNPFAGFFFTRQGRREDLMKQELTDILAFDPSDTEHVGWYYQPKELGKPCWMEPYRNQNVGVGMISYVVPMYIDDTFIGVVGMDIDVNVINSIVRSITPYKTGHAFLCSRDGKIYFHPFIEEGNIVDFAPNLKETLADLQTIKVGESSDIHTYTLDGEERKLAFTKLVNNMILMISAEEKEIDAPVTTLIRNTAIAGVVLSAITVTIVLLFTRHISKPLLQLADVAREISAGNLDVEVPVFGDDEVGTLSKSLSTTVASLRTYVSGMTDKAYRDPLTKVGNKAAYEEMEKDLEKEMDSGFSSFGIVMVDLNDLKTINDTYGHECGDEYLRSGCNILCRVFVHSPVFRIGGDEFVIMLRGEDYENRESLMRLLDERMISSQSEDDPWRRVSFATGLALCEEKDTSPNSVFRRADQKMYENKRRMKEHPEMGGHTS